MTAAPKAPKEKLDGLGVDSAERSGEVLRKVVTVYVLWVSDIPCGEIVALVTKCKLLESFMAAVRKLTRVNHFWEKPPTSSSRRGLLPRKC